MRDAIGPGTFDGVVLFLSLSLLAVGFGVTFGVGLLRGRDSLSRPAWPLCLVNAILAFCLFAGMDAGRFMGMRIDAADLLPPWLVLCGLGYWLLRRSALRER